MQSSSRELLQKALRDKLQSWVDYTNGEYTNGKRRYRLSDLPGKITIQKYYDPLLNLAENKSTFNENVAGWVINLIIMELKDDLEICLAPTSMFPNDTHIKISHADPKFYKISYADPEFYKKIFAAIVPITLEYERPGR